jgi:hypothetical protein
MDAKEGKRLSLSDFRGARAREERIVPGKWDFEKLRFALATGKPRFSRAGESNRRRQPSQGCDSAI